MTQVRPTFLAGLLLVASLVDNEKETEAVEVPLTARADGSPYLGLQVTERDANVYLRAMAVSGGQYKKIFSSPVNKMLKHRIMQPRIQYLLVRAVFRDGQSLVLFAGKLSENRGGGILMTVPRMHLQGAIGYDVEAILVGDDTHVQQASFQIDS